MIRQPWNSDWMFRPRPVEGVPTPDARRVELPHDAVIGGERLNDPRLVGTGYFPGGTWEYSRTLHAPDEWRRRTVVLEFEAVYRSPMVYVNGDLAFRKDSGYGSFAVDLGPFLRFGQDNDIRVEARAHLDSRWYSGGGIIRPVWLLVAEPVHIGLDGVTVTSPEVDDDFAVVRVETLVRNTDRTTERRRVETVLLDAEGTVVGSERSPVTILAGADALVTQRILVPSPRRWSVDSPHLYSAHVRLIEETAQRTAPARRRLADETATTFGIRVLELDARRGLRVNGERVDLRGACVHHDNGVIGAVSIGRDDARRVELLKAAGFNAIRSAHQPMSRAMLDACDRLGVLVMDELTDVWTRGKKDFDVSLSFAQSWREDLQEMVRKDRNRPSVFAYSLGNEIPEIGTGIGAHWMRRLSDYCRALDPTRYTTSGVNGALLVMAERIDGDTELLGDWAEAEVTEINEMMAGLAERMNALGESDAVTGLTEEALSSIDIAGLNYLDSRYPLDRDLFPHRVIVGSETFPTKIDELWRSVLDNDNVIGDFTWTGWDYLGEPGVGRAHYDGVDSEGGGLANYPWVAAWTGDIDITGERRPASFYREIVFGLRPAPYLAVRDPRTYGLQARPAPWSWSDSSASWTWPVDEGTPIEAEVYSDADAVELFVNGRSVGVKPAGRAHRFRAVFDLRYEPGILSASAIRDGSAAESVALRTAGAERHLVVTADRETVHASGTDLLYVAVDLVDSDGVRATDAEDLVRVEVRGPAVLQGFGSAAPRTEESFADDVHSTFRGHALAVVRPTGAGIIEITASGRLGRSVLTIPSLGDDS